MDGLSTTLAKFEIKTSSIKLDSSRQFYCYKTRCETLHGSKTNESRLHV